MASTLVPGLGHLLLGKKPAFYWLMGAQAVTQIVAALAKLHLVAGLLFWPCVRASFALAAFAIVDAGLLCIEMADGRHRPYPPRARLVGFLTLTSYGGGFWRMERRRWAGITCAVGVGLHLVLGSLHPVLRVLSELAVAAAAAWTYSLAQQATVARPTRRIVDTTARAPDSTPAWAMTGAVAVCALALVGAIATGSVGSSLKAARAVRQDGAIAVEPYYRNPHYGLTLELGSPGWSFDRTRPEEFVVARHVAEDALLRLSTRPRVPLLDSAKEAAAQALQDAQSRGYRLSVQGGSAREVAGLQAWDLRASGTHGSARRNVRVVAVADGWRSYVVWFEWGEREQVFAAHELEFVLSHVQLNQR